MSEAIRIRRVFVNLIQNAIDALPGGGELTMGSKKLHGNLEVTFTDTAEGIPKELMENLWKILQTTKAKGMRLGPTMRKRIMQVQGGIISVESAVGKGTTIRLELPITPVQKEVNEA
jgi:two-component system CheB/CheR fusion protein